VLRRSGEPRRRGARAFRWTKGGRYLKYRPPLGIYRPPDRYCAAQIGVRKESPFLVASSGSPTQGRGALLGAG